jgi:hypothetical protein
MGLHCAVGNLFLPHDSNYKVLLQLGKPVLWCPTATEEFSSFSYLLFTCPKKKNFSPSDSIYLHFLLSFLKLRRCKIHLFVKIAIVLSCSVQLFMCTGVLSSIWMSGV